MNSACPVSVLILTFNSDNFIADALESALRQETDFAYEIVVADDGSTDGTRLILRSFQKRWPQKVRLLLQPKNLGSLRNYFSALHDCRGDYIARLDGDDYWISPHKLQTQKTFLDERPECPMCCHDFGVVYGDADYATVTTPSFCPPDRFRMLGVQDLLVRSPAQSSTTMTRKSVALSASGMPDIALKDKVRAVLASLHGDVGYLEETMSVWRVHRGGSFGSSKTRARDGSVGHRVKIRKAHVEFYEIMDDYLEYKYHDLIARVLCRWRAALAHSYWQNRNWQSFLQQCSKFVSCVWVLGRKSGIEPASRALPAEDSTVERASRANRPR